ncbi:DUF4402 domain-containing protein [Phenylobacterium soli]|uniref:DUF4402 domain-containing protein n=1 Tax=Phenylobacterium soli TaxID=2170551 RepID=A0A328ANY6_9CAUL|nr:DUF4402 domain-containing protein [Phenylobacterium soli]RAK55194.1 hypothetical protein DJ017_12010 [Phenylobacterium soli]
MNTSRKLLLAGAAAISTTAVAHSAFAQASATASASASVTVIQPITVTKTADLAFGRVIRPSTGTTTYTVAAADGAPTTSGGDGIFTSGNGSPTRAVFTVHGEGGQAFNITTPASATAGDVTVTLTATDSTGALDGSLGNTGTATFGVGGSITLTNASTTGTKSGNFTVTVAYQ